MIPAYTGNGITIYQGDALTTLAEMEAESVNCVVTSPPYWGLRDYGVDNQLGLEATPEEYISRMVAVFREVRRVLRDDGTLWLNMGDCYQGGNRGEYGKTRGGNGIQQTNLGSDTIGAPNRFPIPGLKPKDLVGMPWMLAFALRSAGWYLRSDIIWSKPNPMPESVTDRPTKAHEYLFLLSKSERYYYDADAISEVVTGTAHARGDGVNPKARIPAGWDTGAGSHNGKTGRYGKEGPNSRMHQDRDPQHSVERKPFRGKDLARDEQGLKVSQRFGRGAGWRNKQNESFSAAVNELVERRNKRSVWTVGTEAFPEAHFATFPQELIKPCILAGCPAGGVVLDPFMGSGTTALVARANGCKAVGIELNPDYIEIAKRRLAQSVMEFPVDTALQSDAK